MSERSVVFRFECFVLFISFSHSTELPYAVPFGVFKQVQYDNVFGGVRCFAVNALNVRCAIDADVSAFILDVYRFKSARFL